MNVSGAGALLTLTLLMRGEKSGGLRVACVILKDTTIW